MQLHCSSKRVGKVMIQMHRSPEVDNIIVHGNGLSEGCFIPLRGNQHINLKQTFMTPEDSLQRPYAV